MDKQTTKKSCVHCDGKGYTKKPRFYGKILMYVNQECWYCIGKGYTEVKK
jgi:DnaJ-class molecular chaperone